MANANLTSTELDLVDLVFHLRLHLLEQCHFEVAPWQVVNAATRHRAGQTSGVKQGRDRVTLACTVKSRPAG